MSTKSLLKICQWLPIVGPLIAVKTWVRYGPEHCALSQSGVREIYIAYSGLNLSVSAVVFSLITGG